jgi:hypothetical protein
MVFLAMARIRYFRWEWSRVGIQHGCGLRLGADMTLVTGGQKQGAGSQEDQRA